VFCRVSAPNKTGEKPPFSENASRGFGANDADSGGEIYFSWVKELEHARISGSRIGKVARLGSQTSSHGC
jgi:hypothetical protein